MPNDLRAKAAEALRRAGDPLPLPHPGVITSDISFTIDEQTQLELDRRNAETRRALNAWKNI